MGWILPTIPTARKRSVTQTSCWTISKDPWKMAAPTSQPPGKQPWQRPGPCATAMTSFMSLPRVRSSGWPIARSSITAHNWAFSSGCWTSPSRAAMAPAPMNTRSSPPRSRPEIRGLRSEAYDLTGKFPIGRRTRLPFVGGLCKQRVAGMQVSKDLDPGVRRHPLSDIHPLSLAVADPDDEFSLEGRGDRRSRQYKGRSPPFKVEPGEDECTRLQKAPVVIDIVFPEFGPRYRIDGFRLAGEGPRKALLRIGIDGER